MGVSMVAFAVMALSFSFNMMVQEQKRHNKAMEQILAEIRDRRPEYVP
jgi:preprotein translocase subunit YajC